MSSVVPIKRRRPVIIIVTLVIAAAVTGVLGMSALGHDLLPAQQMRPVHEFVHLVGMKAMRLKESLVGMFGSYLRKHEEEVHKEHSRIVVTSPKIQDVVLTESFVCQIRSQRHIEVRALEGGYLQKIWIREGQSVKEGDAMFKILPVLYEAKLAAEKAEADVARMKWQFADTLAQKQVISPNEVELAKAERQKAQAKADLAQRELNFTNVNAPFGGIVDRLLQREGSLIKEGDILTTLADNSVMWVYFNVPERYYLDYMATRARHEKEDRIELVLANGQTFPQAGTIGAIEADFNNENGNIKFRADFPNPDALLRHGQTGTIKVRRPMKDAVLIPQRATFDILDKQYAWVLDQDDVAHQTLITIQNVLEDVFVIKSGLTVKDRFVLEGVRQVEEGAKVEYDFMDPAEALKNQKFHAE
ncbi:Efflux pump periplasmic linker BepF [Aquisphaera giovannonii]|uniref:Efflux pump periplasmic linker BepF n=1 Tax=Aquisphaera giovannonii TaxID=406548 RepID=A0A5B9W825_9BACT|nr:efflux RND transporter periplasmic adaptor subunit [Aquisphaera giovannonii]QEH36738.1 Efflux pump periplasmic linker BepF [Aquisphaera giovannonii]